jgi:hypothetical protein
MTVVRDAGPALERLPRRNRREGWVLFFERGYRDLRTADGWRMRRRAAGGAPGRRRHPHQPASFCDVEARGPTTTDVVALFGQRPLFAAPFRNSSACPQAVRALRSGLRIEIHCRRLRQMSCRLESPCRVSPATRFSGISEPRPGSGRKLLLPVFERPRSKSGRFHARARAR